MIKHYNVSDIDKILDMMIAGNQGFDKFQNTLMKQSNILDMEYVWESTEVEYLWMTFDIRPTACVKYYDENSFEIYCGTFNRSSKFCVDLKMGLMSPDFAKLTIHPNGEKHIQMEVDLTPSLYKCLINLFKKKANEFEKVFLTFKTRMDLEWYGYLFRLNSLTIESINLHKAKAALLLHQLAPGYLHESTKNFIEFMVKKYDRQYIELVTPDLFTKDIIAANLVVIFQSMFYMREILTYRKLMELHDRYSKSGLADWPFDLWRVLEGLALNNVFSCNPILIKLT